MKEALDRCDQARAYVEKNPEPYESWLTLLQAEAWCAYQRKRLGDGGIDPSQVAGLMEGAREKVLLEWRERRPNDAGPDLFRALRLSTGVEQDKGVLGLVEAFPDDAYLLDFAGKILRRAKDPEGARDLFENYQHRHPKDPKAFRLLSEHFRSTGEKVQEEEHLLHWLQEGPFGEELLASWLSSKLPEERSEQTSNLLNSFLSKVAAAPSQQALCERELNQSSKMRVDFGRKCLERLALLGTKEEKVANRARGLLQERKVVADSAKKDWPLVLEEIQALAKERRPDAIFGFAESLFESGRCGDLVDLLRRATELHELSDRPASVAFSLGHCSGRSDAQALFLGLLEKTAPDDLEAILRSWNQGNPPAPRLGDAAEILERRLKREPSKRELWTALGEIYEATGRDDAQQDLLLRRQKALPDSFRDAEALQLAELKADLGQPEDAIDFLSNRRTTYSDPKLVQLLWELLMATGRTDEAARVADEAISTASTSAAVSMGYFLIAQMAFIEDDLAKTERYLWKSLEENAQNLQAVMNLVLLAEGSKGVEAARTETKAICQRFRSDLEPSFGETCETWILRQVGDRKGVMSSIAEEVERLPGSVHHLRRLGSEASAAEQWSVAENAYRRLAQIEPREEPVWMGLAIIYSRTNRLSELKTLCEEAEQALGRKHAGVLLQLGNALLREKQPRAAIAAMLEARGAARTDSMAATIELRLREAYEALGKEGD